MHIIEALTFFFKQTQTFQKHDLSNIVIVTQQKHIEKCIKINPSKIHKINRISKATFFS